MRDNLERQHGRRPSAKVVNLLDLIGLGDCVEFLNLLDLVDRVNIASFVDLDDGVVAVDLFRPP